MHASERRSGEAGIPASASLSCAPGLTTKIQVSLGGRRTISIIKHGS